MIARPLHARAVLALLIAVNASAVAAPARADHAPADATVSVSGNAFRDYLVDLPPNGTVTFDVQEGDHTIVADDGRFAFPVEGGGTLPAGTVVSHTFGATEEVVRYHCTIHGGSGGQGMSGVIVIGHPKVERPPVPVLRVPQDLATVEDALSAAAPGDRIEIAPGTYTVAAPLDLATDGVTLTGVGDDPTDVVLVAELVPQLGIADAVVHVTAAHVTVANLAVRGGDNGVHLDGANQVAVRDVEVLGDDLTVNGVLITAASGAGLRGVTVSDVRRAGVRIEPCAACGVLIEDAELRGGLAGVLASGARGVIVRDSVVRANTVGVVARRQDSRPSTIAVLGNDLQDNRLREVLPAATSDDRRLATGAGVWLDGATDSVVAANHVEGHTFGVVVSAGARGVTVRDNTLARNDTDLAWDGFGLDVCFAGHDATATSAPPAIADLYPCDRPTVGVPFPLVTAGLLLAAYAA